MRPGAGQHIVVANRHVGEGHRVFVAAVGRRGLGQPHTVGLGRPRRRAVGRDDHPIRLVRIPNPDLGAVQLPLPKNVVTGRSGNGAPGSFSAAVSTAPWRRRPGSDPAGRRMPGRAAAPGRGRGWPAPGDGAVAADLGQRRRQLGQADAVTAEALGHAQRRHTSRDECVQPLSRSRTAVTTSATACCSGSG